MFFDLLFGLLFRGETKFTKSEIFFDGWVAVKSFEASKR